MPKTPITLALFATLLAANPAFAAGQDRSVAIRTGDLDLSRPADVRKLNQRVGVAKEMACGSYAGAREDEEARIAECRAGIDQQIEARLASR